MIYIDPPYNTGKDFVYPDNFRDSIGNYKSLTGQTDEEGAATRANPETSGRYHTDWLNMMYPRLILARNLLADDGVIFISIDDTEVDNLKKICNDIFGEDNLVGIGEWRRVEGKPGKSKYMGKTSEFVMIFAKDKEHFQIGLLPYSEAGLKEYRYSDSKGRFRRGQIFYPNRGVHSFSVVTPYGNTITGDFTKSEEDFRDLDAADMIYWAENGDHTPYLKVYLDEDSGMMPTNTFGKEFGSSQSAVKEFKEIFDSDVVYFDNPKPTKLLQKLLLIANLSADSIILDFFSGSATAAHAVMQLNAEDGGNRKFIMVQLPEVCEEGTEAAKAGYKNICEIGKERIRRATKKIKEENPLFAGDMGFKVFKLDTSNIVPWNPNADELRQNLLAAVDNVLADRTTEDLLYEVLLKCNLPLTLPIEKKKFGENTVYIVGAGALAICLDTKIPQTIAEEIVKLRDEYAPIVPMQVVFRDNGFTDVAKTNALQILKQAGFEDKSVQTI